MHRWQYQRCPEAFCNAKRVEFGIFDHTWQRKFSVRILHIALFWALFLNLVAFLFLAVCGIFDVKPTFKFCTNFFFQLTLTLKFGVNLLNICFSLASSKMAFFMPITTAHKAL